MCGTRTSEGRIWLEIDFSNKKGGLLFHLIFKKDICRKFLPKALSLPSYTSFLLIIPMSTFTTETFIKTSCKEHRDLHEAPALPLHSQQCCFLEGSLCPCSSHLEATQPKLRIHTKAWVQLYSGSCVSKAQCHAEHLHRDSRQELVPPSWLCHKSST